MDLFNQSQIRIIQDGADVFVFDTIKWPEKLFPYPIISSVGSFREGSYEANLIGWKPMSREQFEWVLRHHECLISHICLTEYNSNFFYCNNHNCWEKDGKDHSVLSMEENFPTEMKQEERYEERII